MTVRTRLLVLITMLVTVCSLGTAGMLAWLAWRSILARAEEDAVLLARLLAELGGSLGADRRRGGKTAWRADADGSLPGRPARRSRPARGHRRAGIAALAADHCRTHRPGRDLDHRSARYRGLVVYGRSRRNSGRGVQLQRLGCPGTDARGSCRRCGHGADPPRRGRPQLRLCRRADTTGGGPGRA